MAGQTRIDGNLIDTGTDPNDIVSVSVGDTRYPRLSQDNTLAGNLTVDGQVRSDNVTDSAGTGAPAFPNGMSVTGAALTDPEITGGIYLGGTGAANYLEDYEEGTWTPNINSAYNFSPSVTYTVQNGSYTKIGRIVVAAFDIEISSFSGGGGPVFFGGLPFTPATTTDARFQGTAYLSGPNTPSSTVTVNLGYAELDNGSYYLVFNCPRDDTAMANAGTLQTTDFAASDTVAGTFTYFV